MALNSQFKVKNDLNSLGRILSGGVDLSEIFSPSNTTFTFSGYNTTFSSPGNSTISFKGSNGLDTRLDSSTKTIITSGINATSTVKGVASFSTDNFTVTDGAVIVKDGGINNDELAGNITDTKLLPITASNKVANSATTATSNNTVNAIVARGASGEFSSGSITVTGNVSASNIVYGSGSNSQQWGNVFTQYSSTSSSFATNTLLQSTSGLLTPITVTRTLTGELLPATTYQNTSGSFATNTLLRSTSGLLTPITVTRTLTGQLVLNTNFDNYKTSVAASTGTLLLTTIYQNASSNWQNTYTNVQNNSGNWQTAYNVATVYQLASGSAATLTTTRKLWGQDFNGSQNVSGTLSAVGDIIGSSSITLSAGSGNNNINLRPSGSGLVTVTGNLSASNTITSRDITATNLLSAANTFTRQLSVGNVQVRTLGSITLPNVFIGNASTGRDASTGSHNFAFGNNAGQCLTSGSSNNFLGNAAGLCTTGGSNNNFLGDGAGQRNTTGNNNNLFGAAAGYDNTSGSGNNFLGFNAGTKNTVGINNNFFGNGAGNFNTTGSYNNFLGFFAGVNNNDGGCHNNFFGHSAGYANTAGCHNNFFGNNAGRNSLGKSSFNNFIGYKAGYTNFSGSNNTIIGNQADVTANGLSGVVVLGTGAVATESHQIVLETANVSFKSKGSTFEIGTPSLTDNLTVYGAVSSTGIVNTNTGFRISNGATPGHVLRGNGTNFVSSTLAAADIASGQALTKTDDANVTLTLGGASSVALLSAVSLTLGWTGVLSAARGGTGNAFTQFSGPSSSLKTFTLPNASAKILTDNAAVAISEGGTGQTTAQAAINALVGGAGTSGRYLRSDGSNVVLTGIQVSDVPILNQNTTGSAASANVLITSRTLWGQSFNGGANVSGNLSDVGNVTLGTQTNKATITYTTNTARTYTIPDAGTNASFVMTEGNQTINGTKTFGSAIAGSITGSAATLTNTRTLWGQSFNGGANVSGNLTGVGNIVGSGAITLSAANNNNLNLVAGGTGNVVVNGNFFSSNLISTGALSVSAANNNNINLISTGTGNVVINRADINGGTIDGVSIGSSSVATYLKVDNVAINDNDITFSSPGGNINHAAGQYVAINGGSAGTQANLTGPIGADLVIGTRLNDATRARITLAEATNGNITFATNGTGNVVINRADINGGAIDGTPIGLTSPASGVFTGVTVSGDVNINGSLYISGSSTRIDTTNLIVSDPIIFLAEGNLTDDVDIGFTAAYNHGSTPPRHTGLIRNNIGGEWTLFSNLSSEVLSAIQIPLDNPSLVIDTLNANIKGNVTGTLSGTANKANSLTTGRTISATGDISYVSDPFDGSANVTGTATITNSAVNSDKILNGAVTTIKIANDAVTTSKILNNNVTLAKLEQIAGNTILGNSTSSTGNVTTVACTSAGRALLDDADAAAQRSTLGLGSSNSVTFGNVTVNNGTISVLRNVYSDTTGGGASTQTLNLFADANYNTAKITIQVKQGTGASAKRCALETLCTRLSGSGATALWEGTVYAIVDPQGIFQNVNINVDSGTVQLLFNYIGSNVYTATASVEAISD